MCIFIGIMCCRARVRLIFNLGVSYFRLAHFVVVVVVFLLLLLLFFFGGGGGLYWPFQWPLPFYYFFFLSITFCSHISNNYFC